MHKIKKLILSGVMTLGILSATLVAAPVAFAEPAHAVTMTQCSTQWYKTYSSSYNAWVKVTTCYYDYNWWEETWGWHDGWYGSSTPIYT